MLKVLLPIVILLLGISGAYAIMATRPVLQSEPPVSNIPVVQIITAQPQTLRLNVQSQGVVQPTQEMDLTTEVAGKVVYLQADFVAGGTFQQGEVLARIDTTDVDVAIVQAQAQIAEAHRQLATEQAQAEQARTEWQALGQGTPTALAMREPQLAEARAKLKAAEANLAFASVQRQRCEIRAPFSGRFYSKAIALGQSLQKGDKLARLYATDKAEVRLPVSLEQLAYLNLSSHSVPYERGIPVQLSAAAQVWQARIVRSEGVVGDSTSVVYLVAQVIHPDKQQPPLWTGLFVQADIQGVERELFTLPQQAMNALQNVLIVDDKQQVHSRQLSVLRSEQNRLLIENGLNAGERVVVSGVDVPIEGMRVKVVEKTN